MSALGAFFRGAAGPGMLALADSYERRDREERLLAERRQNLEAEQAFRAEQNQKDRMARYGSDGTEPGMLATARAARSGGAGGEGAQPGANMGDIGRIMQQTGMSAADAQKAMQASASGQNPYTKDRQVPEQFDDGDGRMKTVSKTVSDPDEERWINLNKQLGKVWSESASRAKSNYEQLTAGEGNAQRNTITSGMLSGALAPSTAAEAVAASKGEGAYGKGGVNQFSGAPDAVGKSAINENNAQAGSAGRANRDGGKDSKPDTDWLKDEYKAVTQEIAKARASGGFDPKKDPQQQALLDRALDLEGKLSAAGQSVDDKAIAAAVAAQLAAAKNGGKPAPTQSDARKNEKPDAEPAATAPTSGRAQVVAQSKNRDKAEADPEVKALRQQIAEASSGRQANSLKAKLNDILATRYGL